jgi:hypothetical protein
MKRTLSLLLAGLMVLTMIVSASALKFTFIDEETLTGEEVLNSSMVYDREVEHLFAANGTPTIDGTKDSVYSKGETALVETVTWSYEYSKPTGTTGKINAVWDNDALYVYAEIKDATGPYTGYALEKPGNLWRNDGITVFVDVMDTKTGTTNFEVLTPLSFMVMIDASGTLVVKDSGENVCTEEFAGYQVKTKKISGGYVIEAKIPWYPMVQGMVKEGKTIGFDIQINDSFNDTVGRQAQVYWSDYTGDSFLYLDRWGQLILKK